MGERTLVRLDSRGRIVIPMAFREVCKLKPGRWMMMDLDLSNRRLMIFPFAKEDEDLMKITARISDKSGSLHRLLRILSNNNIDLIMTESRSINRGRHALWEAVVDFSHTKMSTTDLKKKVLKAKVVEDIMFSSLQ